MINIKTEHSRIAFKIKVIEEELEEDTDKDSYIESTELEGFLFLHLLKAQVWNQKSV